MKIHAFKVEQLGQPLVRASGFSYCCNTIR